MNRRRFILAASGALALAGCTEETDRQSGPGGSNGGGGGGDSQNRVEILDHSLYRDQFTAGVEGRLENVSDETLSYVQVNAYFFTSNETRIGEGVANTSDLRPGRRWQFDALFLGDNPEEIDSYEVSAEVTNF